VGPCDFDPALMIPLVITKMWDPSRPVVLIEQSPPPPFERIFKYSIEAPSEFIACALFVIICDGITYLCVVLEETLSL
jgi:hypothetical protein